MFDIAIIGAGPAGITAGIYARRFNLNVVVFENNAPGGAIINTETINNYPGFESISGYDLAYAMFNQLMNLTCEFVSEEAIEIKKKQNNIFNIKTTSKVYEAKSVIIASGTHNKTLDIPTEKKYLYNGISWCAICDGPLYKNKDVAVIGGGMSAISSALTLSELANKVYLIHHRNDFRGERTDFEKLLTAKNVEILTSYVVEAFNGEEKLDSITLRSVDNNEIKTINVSGVFECVGKVPNSRLVSDIAVLDNNGYIIVNKDYETNLKGLYACGDVVSKNIRQIATAVNDGAIAAISINEYLKHVIF